MADLLDIEKLRGFAIGAKVEVDNVALFGYHDIIYPSSKPSNLNYYDFKNRQDNRVFANLGKLRNGMVGIIVNRQRVNTWSDRLTILFSNGIEYDVTLHNYDLHYKLTDKVLNFPHHYKQSLFSSSTD